MFSITWDTGAGVVTTTASSKSNSSGSNGSNRSSAGSDLVPSGYLNPNMSGEFGSYLLKSYNQPVPRGLELRPLSQIVETLVPAAEAATRLLSHPRGQ